MSGPARDRGDSCPGALTTHAAADGPLARIRLPGGMVTDAQLRVLAGCADELGDGSLHLTSRANVQLRAVPDPPELAARVGRAGLLPAARHERVRNILASPRSGLIGGVTDVRPLVPALDEAICADPALARLPGRFQFGLDDGSGDLPLGTLDAGWYALAGGVGALVLGGADSGLRVSATHVVDALVAGARAFLAARDSVLGPDRAAGAWHVRDLPGAGAGLTAAVLSKLPADVAHEHADTLRGTAGRRDPVAGEPVAVGVHAQDDGAHAVVAGCLFGATSAEQIRLVAGLAPHAVVTPWRSLLLPGLTGRAARDAASALTDAGFLLDPVDPALRITACIGRPGCASSATDVRADARRLAAAVAPGVTPTVAPGTAVHVAGCERRCGRPHTEHVDVVGIEDGYAVDGAVVSTDQLASSLEGPR